MFVGSIPTAAIRGENMIACIVDIDGTLANAAHRIHYIQNEKPDWDMFSHPDLLRLDTPQPGAREALDHFREMGYHVCFLTGRNEKYRKETEHWLNTHMGRKRPQNEVVYMRGGADKDVAASVYKERQVSKLQYIFEDEDNPCSLLFFEDDPFVCNMYRKYGTVFKAPECWPLIIHGAADHEVEPVKRY